MPKAKCRNPGCTNYAQIGGVCVRHGARVKLCSSEGCTNQAIKGGVCIRHGAKVKVKRCSSEGCTNRAIEGGVCIRHGAKVKFYQCNSEGCTTRAIKGGVCIKHGAQRKLCSSEGCTNLAKNGGVCKRHGAKVKVKRCSSEGCTNLAQIGGVCIRHGAKVKLCSSEGCTNLAQTGGVCIRHGAKVKLCSSEGCTNHVQRGGVCKRHGAKVKRCSSEGCTNQAKKGGLCIRHGAKVKLCSSEGCTNLAKKGGLCIRHGANKRTSPNEINQEGNEIVQPLPPLPSIELRDDAPKPKRRRTSARSNGNRTNSSPNRPVNASELQSSRVALKRKARRKNNSDEVHDVDKDTSAKKRRKTNPAAAAAQTLLSFASRATAFDVNADNSISRHDDDNVDSFQFNDSETTRVEPHDLSVIVNLESLPAVIWDDSCFSVSPSISKFLTIEEVKNVRLVSKMLHLHNPTKRATLRVDASTPKQPIQRQKRKSSSSRLFLERARTFLDPAKEFFNRSQVEFVRSSFITSCHNFLGDRINNEQGFFQYTNCLSKVKELTLSRPGDFTILRSLGDMQSLEKLSFRKCFPFYITRPCRMYLRSSYSSQDYRQNLKNVGYIELTKSSIPRLLLKDLFQAAPKLKKLKFRRCRDEDTSGDDFFEALSTLEGLEEFKFVPGYLLEPSATVVRPTEDHAATAGLDFIHREQAARDEIDFIRQNNELMEDLLRGDAAARESLELVLQNQDEFTCLSARLIVSVCNTQNEGLKSLSMRNVELLGGVGIEPLRRLKCIEKICLCALSSFEEYHLRLFHDVGKETLRKLSLVHCRLIEGHLRHLVGLRQLEELSLLSTYLCDYDIESLSNMRQLKVLNVFGQIENDCDFSSLRRSGNLRHLSLQIYNKVSPDIAQQLNGMVSLESLCLRMRFLGVHEMDIDDDVPFIPVSVDDESTLNFSVNMKSDANESVAGETILDDEIQENALMEESPFDFSGLYNLHSLLIYDSILTDYLVESISGLHQLRELSLWHCQELSEESISHLSKMKSLEKLCLHRFDAMSASGLETLSSSLSSIKELEFYQCGIMRNVEIDNNLGLMKRLRKLTISPYYLEKPTNLTHIQLIKDDSDRNAEKRVKHLLGKIRNRGMF